MQGFAAGIRNYDPEAVAVRSPVKRLPVNSRPRKLRYRVLRVELYSQPRPWEQKFNGLWCDEGAY